MADGDFSHRIDVRYHDEFSSIADSINRMADTVEAMKQKEQEAEETKNELITNVAHDLRTFFIISSANFSYAIKFNTCRMLIQ